MPLLKAALTTARMTAFKPGASPPPVSVGPAPGTVALAYVVGPVTTVSFDSPQLGSGWVRVEAFDATGFGAPSNEVLLSVGTLQGVPAAPVNLQAFITGTTVVLNWAGGAGGGAPQSLLFEVGTAPGAANLGSYPLGLTTQTSVPNVPVGTYFVRIYAVNSTGRSAASNEVRIDMPPGGSCTAPPATTLVASSTGNVASFGWGAVPGIAGYLLEVSSSPTGPVVLSQPFPPGTTAVSYPNAPAGTYYARIVTGAACGAQSASPVVSFTVAAPPPGSGPRTPNPPPGQRLPLPNMSSVVNQVARAYPNDLRNSCAEHGGNNIWLYRLVQALRRYDTRWGLNWKRGRRGDMSQDVVNYNYSADPDEGTQNVYIIDVIGGHCGPNPEGAWIDQTEATRNAGSIGIWTLQPYINAGGTP
jgi:hypothetical protein